MNHINYQKLENVGDIFGEDQSILLKSIASLNQNYLLHMHRGLALVEFTDMFARYLQNHHIQPIGL